MVLTSFRESFVFKTEKDGEVGKKRERKKRMYQKKKTKLETASNKTMRMNWTHAQSLLSLCKWTLLFTQLCKGSQDRKEAKK